MDVSGCMGLVAVFRRRPNTARCLIVALVGLELRSELGLGLELVFGYAYVFAPAIRCHCPVRHQKMPTKSTAVPVAL